MEDLPIVQFGKYKGKSILELLDDEKYLEWCKSQPGMLEKYPAVFNIVYQQSNKTNDAPTPEHNKLQNMFLNKNIQLNLIKYLRNNDISFINDFLENEEYKKYFKPNENGYDIIKNFLNKNNIKFEAEHNWDMKLNGMVNTIFFEFNDEQYDNIKQEFIKNTVNEYGENSPEFHKDLKGYVNNFYYLFLKKNFLDRINFTELYIGNDSFRSSIGRNEDNILNYITNYKYFKLNLNLLPVICCEIKPILGDDYPCVLRKMSNQIKLGENKYSSIIYCLIVDKFKSSVTSFDQLKTIFKQHNILVILTSEIFGDDINLYLSPEQIKIKELEDEIKQLKEKLNIKS